MSVEQVLLVFLAVGAALTGERSSVLIVSGLIGAIAGVYGAQHLNDSALIGCREFTVGFPLQAAAAFAGLVMDALEPGHVSLLG